ncbi:chromosome segregation protein Spc25-domain-containing protein [Glomus cerebriforme]|uniref:Kinetochore protein SPC25 n=1 Tax=Glomus cerebriforme TaxID=658196 RepID=A0A397T671_9GLOM|nr:chromosome segregation protein Spc25-domain-containing protein [Glomus cerebriforme]
MYSASSTPARTPSKAVIYKDTSISSLNHASNINIKNSNIFFISRVNFNYEIVRHKNKLFEDEFIDYVNSMKTNLSLKKQQWQSTFSADKGTKSQLIEQVKLAEKKQKDDLAAKEKEKRDISKIQIEISDKKYKKEMIKERVSALKNQIENLKKDIQKRRDVNIAKQQALQVQLSKNEPELKRYADKLAFTMVGLKENVISFSFTYIYEKDLSRPCKFTIHLGEEQHSIYKILECSPPIDHLDEILLQLNTKRDFFMFLKKMRQAFYRYVRNDNN